jgi:predicted DCC family thiol-disulfide oxidoreductase YuxK
MIVIYDDKCDFCQWFVNLMKHRINDFKSIPVRNEEAKQLLRDYGVKFIELNTIFIVKDKNIYNKSKAIFLMLQETNLPLKAITIFSLLPLKITDSAYVLFAKNRQRISKFLNLKKFNH